MSSSIVICNISDKLNESHIKDLFECVGPVSSCEIRLVGMDVSRLAERRCYITFEDASHANAAEMLSGTPLGERELKVYLLANEPAPPQPPQPLLPLPSTPSSSSASSEYFVPSASALALASTNPAAQAALDAARALGNQIMARNQIISNNINNINYNNYNNNNNNNNNNSSTFINPSAPLQLQLSSTLQHQIQLPLSSTPLPSSLTAAQAKHIDETNRTVYVGNLGSQLNEELLRSFFSTINDRVIAVKMVADAGLSQQYAFVEFETVVGAQSALLLSQTQLLDRVIRIGKATNPILKTPAVIQAMIRYGTLPAGFEMPPSLQPFTNPIPSTSPSPDTTTTLSSSSSSSSLPLLSPSASTSTPSFNIPAPIIAPGLDPEKRERLLAAKRLVEERRIQQMGLITNGIPIPVPLTTAIPAPLVTSSSTDMQLSTNTESSSSTSSSTTDPSTSAVPIDSSSKSSSSSKSHSSRSKSPSSSRNHRSSHRSSSRSRSRSRSPKNHRSSKYHRSSRSRSPVHRRWQGQRHYDDEDEYRSNKNRILNGMGGSNNNSRSNSSHRSPHDPTSSYAINKKTSAARDTSGMVFDGFQWRPKQPTLTQDQLAKSGAFAK